jgi:hypothetical protein
MESSLLTCWALRARQVFHYVAAFGYSLEIEMIIETKDGPRVIGGGRVPMWHEIETGDTWHSLAAPGIAGSRTAIRVRIEDEELVCATGSIESLPTT